MSLSLEGMAGAVYVNQAVGFGIESAGCGLALLVMTRLGCRVTVAYSVLQGQHLPLPLPLPAPLPLPVPLPWPLPAPVTHMYRQRQRHRQRHRQSLPHGTAELTMLSAHPFLLILQCWNFVLCKTHLLCLQPDLALRFALSASFKVTLHSQLDTWATTIQLAYCCWAHACHCSNHPLQAKDRKVHASMQVIVLCI